MDSDTRARAGEVLCEVIEQMAFMFGEPAQKSDIPPCDEPALRVDMEFSGPLRGCLMLAATPEAAAEIAANMLGLDPGDAAAAERAEDAFKELLNVVCGTILTDLAGTEPVFNLTVPQVSHPEPEDWAELLEEDETDAYQVDDYSVIFRLVFR